MNRLINLALLLAIVAAVVASFSYLGLDLAALGQADNLGHMADYAARFLQPDLSSGHLLAIGRGALETLAMSALGTLLAALLGLFLALPAAGRFGVLAQSVTRLLLNGLRAIPELVWAALMVLAATTPIAAAPSGRRTIQPARIGRPAHAVPVLRSLLTLSRVAKKVLASPVSWASLVMLVSSDRSASARAAAMPRIHPRLSMRSTVVLRRWAARAAEVADTDGPLRPWSRCGPRSSEPAPRLHQRESQQVEAGPALGDLRELRVGGEADAPDPVDRRRLDQHLLPREEEEVTEAGVAAELRDRPGDDDVPSVLHPHGLVEAGDLSSDRLRLRG